MAEAVAETIANLDKLVVEAGTGTGKTFAYLLPALLSGRKTIISTGTKALQDQLYHRDLPLISKAVGRPVTAALLKGRANYLCIERLDHAEANESVVDDLLAVREWRYRTTSGDRAELTEISEESRVWPLVTSTVDNCLGQKCPEYSSCHVVKARRAAQEADLVVVNHHLLLADLAMKEEGFVEFLPGAEAIILDEAHQIPDLAVQFFGVALGSRELERLVDEIRVETMPFRSAGVAATRRCIADRGSRIARGGAAKRRPASAGGSHGRAPGPLNALQLALGELNTAIAEIADASPELEKLHEQLGSMAERLSLLVS